MKKNIEVIEKELDAELRLFNMYSFFLIGLVTGITSILINQCIYEVIIFNLLIIGFIFLFIITIFVVFTFFRIRKLIKKLKS